MAQLLPLVRRGLSTVTRKLPRIPGLGRCVLLADAALTNHYDPHSFMTDGIVNRGCRLILDLRCWEQKFAFYYGTWESDLIVAVKQCFGDGIFYDVGASIGLYSTIFGRICRDSTGFVRAIEPVPDNRERLRQQLSLNQLGETHVRIEPVALGDHEGVVAIMLTDHDRPGNAKICGSGNHHVQVITLDALWRKYDREYIRFLKIDTEGWDAKIISGGHEAISECRPNMLIEFNRERMRNLHIPLEPCWRFLTVDLSYKTYVIEAGGRLRQVFSPETHENILFLSPG